MFGIVGGIICLGIAGVIYFYMYKVNKRNRDRAKWFSTLGQIIENTQEWESRDDEPILMQTIKYNYSVGEQRYKSSIKFHYNNLSGLNRGISRYKNGDSVEVIYNPYDVEDSTLKVYDHSLDFEPIMIGIILTILGLIFLLTGLKWN